MGRISGIVTVADEPVAFAPAGALPTEEHAPERDVTGRFAPFPEPEVQDSDKPAPIDVSRPPKRLPTRTKGIWQTLPVPLREDIIAREAEFDAAFRKYDGLGGYALQAERAGTTLAAAFASYVAAENSLRADIVAGVEHLIRQIGADPRPWSPRSSFRGLRQGPREPAQPAFDPPVDASFS